MNTRFHTVLFIIHKHVEELPYCPLYIHMYFLLKSVRIVWLLCIYLRKFLNKLM